MTHEPLIPAKGRLNRHLTGKPPPKDGFPVRLRWLTQHDIPQLVRLESSKATHAWTEADFLSSYWKHTNVGLVAEHEDRIVGFAIYEPKKTRLHLLNFGVATEHRRQGVGTQMLEHLIHKMRGQRRRQLSVVVDERDLETQLFLAKCGFKATSVIRDYFADSHSDGYYMRVLRQRTSTEITGTAANRHGVEPFPRGQGRG
jgi:ribosomal-protein-alanine N-acetyltransferase